MSKVFYYKPSTVVVKEVFEEAAAALPPGYDYLEMDFKNVKIRLNESSDLTMAHRDYIRFWRGHIYDPIGPDFKELDSKVLAKETAIDDRKFADREAAYRIREEELARPFLSFSENVN